MGKAGNRAAAFEILKAMGIKVAPEVLEQAAEEDQEKREKIKAYYEANRENIAAYQKAYREANREKIAAHKKAYREVNREKIAAQEKAYYEAKKAKRTARNELEGVIQ